jgi:hypothetical protein
MLEHHPDEVPLVREMVEAIASGRMSVHGLAVALNGRGLRTTRGSRWTAGAVIRVVTNSLHTGVVPIDRWYVHEPKKRKTPYPKRIKSSASERPREEWPKCARRWNIQRSCTPPTWSVSANIGREAAQTSDVEVRTHPG